ncbi:hypothetical protein ACFQ0G_53115 [Streptomyces chiangmaiensis]
MLRGEEGPAAARARLFFSMPWRARKATTMRRVSQPTAGTIQRRPAMWRPRASAMMTLPQTKSAPPATVRAIQPVPRRSTRLHVVQAREASDRKTAG